MEPFVQRLELTGAQVRGSATSEIHELQFSSGHGWALAEQLDLAGQGLHVPLDGLGVLVGVDAKVAELAPLATKGNVQVEPQRMARVRGRRIERRAKLGQEIPLPLRKRRIVGDEIAADFGRFCRLNN